MLRRESKLPVKTAPRTAEAATKPPAKTAPRTARMATKLPVKTAPRTAKAATKPPVKTAPGTAKAATKLPEPEKPVYDVGAPMAQQVSEVLAREAKYSYVKVEGDLHTLEQLEPLNQARDGTIPILTTTTQEYVRMHPSNAIRRLEALHAMLIPSEGFAELKAALGTSLVLAGGAVSRAIWCATESPERRRLRSDKWGVEETVPDLDLFLVGLSPEKAKMLINMLAKSLQKAYRSVFEYRSERCITFRLPRDPQAHLRPPGSGLLTRTIQIVLRLYNTPSEIVHGFDLGSSAVAYYQGQVVMSAKGKYAYERGLNILDLSRRRASYETRIVKYAERGFGIVLPLLNVDRVRRVAATTCGLVKLPRLQIQLSMPPPPYKGLLLDPLPDPLLGPLPAPLPALPLPALPLPAPNRKTKSRAGSSFNSDDDSNDSDDDGDNDMIWSHTPTLDMGWPSAKEIKNLEEDKKSLVLQKVLLKAIHPPSIMQELKLLQDGESRSSGISCSNVTDYVPPVSMEEAEEIARIAATMLDEPKDGPENTKSAEEMKLLMAGPLGSNTSMLGVIYAYLSEDELLPEEESNYRSEYEHGDNLYRIGRITWNNLRHAQCATVKTASLCLFAHLKDSEDSKDKDDKAIDVCTRGEPFVGLHQLLDYWCKPHNPRVRSLAGLLGKETALRIIGQIVDGTFAGHEKLADAIIAQYAPRTQIEFRFMRVEETTCLAGGGVLRMALMTPEEWYGPYLRD